MRPQKLKLIDVRYHRNGIAGEGFHAVDFFDHGTRMRAIVFAKDERDPLNVRVAVTTQDLSERWRGDHYADWLYEQVGTYQLTNA